MNTNGGAVVTWPKLFAAVVAMVTLQSGATAWLIDRHEARPHDNVVVKEDIAALSRAVVELSAISASVQTLLEQHERRLSEHDQQFNAFSNRIRHLEQRKRKGKH